MCHVTPGSPYHDPALPRQSTYGQVWRVVPASQLQQIFEVKGFHLLPSRSIQVSTSSSGSPLLCRYDLDRALTSLLTPKKTQTVGQAGELLQQSRLHVSCASLSQLWTQSRFEIGF